MQKASYDIPAMHINIARELTVGIACKFVATGTFNLAPRPKIKYLQSILHQFECSFLFHYFNVQTEVKSAV